MMRRRDTRLAALAAAVALSTLSLGAQATAKITVESTAFKNGAPIPADYTADGKNVSPPLTWSGVPSGTQELALIMDDPDAPTPQPFVHWVIYKIPGSATGLPEAIPPGGKVQSGPIAGAVQGANGFAAFARGGPPAEPGYRGPAPPPGKPHNYTFKVYALSAALDVQEGLDKAALLKAMEGKIIGEGQLVGVYERKAGGQP